MAFFLGKDVTVACSTENTADGIQVGVNGTVAFDDVATGFADALDTSTPVGTTGSWNQLTSVELNIGAMDEDISYFGMRSQTKAEIKKDTTVTFTRKKVNNEWDVIFNDARFGGDGSNAVLDGLEEPSVTKGYRIFITIEPGTRNASNEVITLMGCCVQSHTVTMNTDGTMDETLELMTYIEPVYRDTKYGTAITTAIL
tara:strand:+ start:123 stop:719 length:597 start_codon:yes stop_codon:yes gene_type:complete